MAVPLYDYQVAAVEQMHSGCILCGGVGSGKSRTSLAWYFRQNGGRADGDRYIPMKNPKDLYIITTARKRDTGEWEEELVPFLLSSEPKRNRYKNKVVIDSWNRIKVYKNVTNAIFIFDEQRVIGSGAWVKSFLKIAKNNTWILLSATPGDTWTDYIPVFIANGFYKNRTSFNDEHVVYSRFSKYPKVDRYLKTAKLTHYRDQILVNMDFKRQTNSHHIDILTEYNQGAYKSIGRTRWNPYEDKPIETASELCYLWRKVVNSDESRQEAIKRIFLEGHHKLIIFYNFNYELELLENMDYGGDVEIAEWNGRVHQPIPTGDQWVYLVQYTAGCEGWNCVSTDTIVFYSQNYSYRIMTQAAGRIDRLNTRYNDLYYYHLKSRSNIDLAISRALKMKKNFNESQFVNKRKV